MKFAKYLAAAAVLAIAPAAAQAQDVGATVMGNDGNAVGTVVANDGTNATVDTGTHQVPLPLESFGTSEAGPTLNITKTALDEMMAAQVAAAEAAQAEAEAAVAAAQAEALAAALVVGTPVITRDAQSLGMIDEIAGENVVIKGVDEQLVTLPNNLFWVDGEGALTVLATMEQIQAAMGG